MDRDGEQDLIRADRWCCRIVLVIELLLIAWSGGRSAAGLDLVDVTVFFAALGICVVSLAVAVWIHGWTVLGFDSPRRSPRSGD
ncbi:MAG TPA: hypothetical protein VFO60_07655 [Candidatus Dormibacteraeota bacterium]|nr:hypothetical protein [Candidatus Dormibacteraeota bacterium]